MPMDDKTELWEPVLDGLASLYRDVERRSQSLPVFSLLPVRDLHASGTPVVFATCATAVAGTVRWFSRAAYLCATLGPAREGTDRDHQGDP